MQKDLNLFNIIDDNLKQLFSNQCPDSLAIACSGGLDSVALVLLVTQWIQVHQHRCQVHVVTVDHQLRATSGQEAVRVTQMLRYLNITHHVLTWHHGPLTTKIQEQARQARYRLLLDFCASHAIQWLLFGHHLDDQIHTVTMRLLSRSSFRGLAGISAHSIVHRINTLRPLLNIRKHTLRQYLMQQGITWIEDPTNLLRVYQRNDLQHINVSLPFSWLLTLSRYRIAEEKWTSEFLARYGNFSDLGYWEVDAEACQRLPINFRVVVIQQILLTLSCAPYPARLKSIQLLCQKMVHPDFRAATIQGYCIKRKRNKLIFYRLYNIIKSVQQPYSGDKVTFDQRWLVDIQPQDNNLTVSCIGLRGWSALIQIAPQLKKIDIDKTIFMALPWFWHNGQLWRPKIFIENVIMREKGMKNVLRLNSSYQQSPFVMLNNLGDYENETLNVRIIQ